MRNNQFDLERWENEGGHVGGLRRDNRRAEISDDRRLTLISSPAGEDVEDDSKAQPSR